MTYFICPMRTEDIPQVMEIEREAFPDQWPPPSYRGELKNRLARYFILIEGDAPPRERLAAPAAPGENGKPHFDWHKAIWRFLKNLFSRTSGNGVTGQSRPTIIGAAGFWLMVDESHITTIAVRSSHRGRGLGELLLVHAIELSAELKAQVVTLEVRVSNSIAQKLYQKYGFARVGVRKGYYTDNGEDAFIMTTEKVTSADFQKRLQSLKKELSKKLDQEISPAPECKV